MDTDTRNTFVTERLAAGLARQAIRQWRERASANRARVADLGHRRFTTGKGAARAARDAQRMLEPFAFHSTSATFKRKGVVQVWVLPEVATIDDMEYLAIEFDLCTADSGGFRSRERRYLGFIHPHALARMFLRLQTTAFEAVREQIRSSFYMYAALAETSRVLGLAQMVIQTRDGHFRCDVRADARQPCALVAKTWISSTTSGQRDPAVIESTASALCAWNDRASAAERHEIAVLMRSPDSLIHSLADALLPHRWLTEPYVERPDHLTAMWETARQQANREQEPA